MTSESFGFCRCFLCKKTTQIIFRWLEYDGIALMREPHDAAQPHPVGYIQMGARSGRGEMMSAFNGDFRVVYRALSMTGQINVKKFTCC